MNINTGTKFNIGQLVTRVYWRTYMKWVKCPACRGTGRITVNGKEYDCPEVCEDGEVEHPDRKVWEIVESGLVVRDIRLHIFIRDGETRIEESYSLFTANGRSYGNIEAKELFATDEDALAWCAKRMKEYVSEVHEGTVSKGGVNARPTIPPPPPPVGQGTGAG
jgi:hypothetical protein